MSKKPSIEIAIVVYDKAQMAAVLGLTDLLIVASKIAAKRQNAEKMPLQVSHWAISEAQQPTVTFSSDPNNVGALTAIIIPPTLAAPIEQKAAMPWLEWLKAQHAQGVILSSVCAGAFLLGECGY